MFYGSSIILLLFSSAVFFLSFLRSFCVCHKLLLLFFFLLFIWCCSIIVKRREIPQRINTTPTRMKDPNFYLLPSLFSIVSSDKNVLRWVPFHSSIHLSFAVAWKMLLNVWKLFRSTKSFFMVKSCQRDNRLLPPENFALVHRTKRWTHKIPVLTLFCIKFY